MALQALLHETFHQDEFASCHCTALKMEHMILKAPAVKHESDLIEHVQALQASISGALPSVNTSFLSIEVGFQQDGKDALLASLASNASLFPDLLRRRDMFQRMQTAVLQRGFGWCGLEQCSFSPRFELALERSDISAGGVDFPPVDEIMTLIEARWRAENEGLSVRCKLQSNAGA